MSPAPSKGMETDELAKRMKANGVKNGRVLSIRVGVSEATASRWINGKSTITIGMATLIRQKLPKLR